MLASRIVLRDSKPNLGRFSGTSSLCNLPPAVQDVYGFSWRVKTPFILKWIKQAARRNTHIQCCHQLQRKVDTWGDGIVETCVQAWRGLECHPVFDGKCATWYKVPLKCCIIGEISWMHENDSLPLKQISSGFYGVTFVLGWSQMLTLDLRSMKD